MKINKAAPVAVFDSGVGGIGVLGELQKTLPNESFVYFGDSKNAPYGGKKSEEILKLVEEHAARLLEGAKALVLACNTATAVAADTLRMQYKDTPIIGMEPALKPAFLYATQKKRGHVPTVLVLATPTTLAEQKFKAQLCRYRRDCRIIPLPAPHLVTLVEAGLARDAQTKSTLKLLLAPYTGANTPDAVVLGCTHFPFARDAISTVFGGAVPLFDGAGGTARETARRLAAADLLAPAGSSHTPRITLKCSDESKLPFFLEMLQSTS